VLRATVISGSGISGSGGSFRVVLSPLQGGGDEGGDDEDNVAELETEIGEEVDEGPSPIVPEIRELVWTAGAFVVFALLMRYLLYPRVRRGMDARYNSIATGHSSAEATRAAARAEIADYERQLAAVRGVLADIDAQTTPEIVVVNKADVADPMVITRLLAREPHSVVVSARTGYGTDDLRAAIEADLPHPQTEVNVLLPYARGDLMSRIHERGEVVSVDHTGEGTAVVARVNAGLAAELAPYSVTSV